MQDSVYKAVFESSPVALLLADDARRYVDANPAACRLFGMTRAELLEKRIDDFLPSAGDERSVEALWQDFLSTGKQVAELDLTQADGQVRTVSFSAQAGVLPGLHLSVLFDVTEERSAARRSAAERELLYIGAQRSRDRVTRLQTVTASLARARTLSEVAQVIVNEGCTAFDATRGIVALVVEAGTAMEIVSVRKDELERVSPGQQFPLSEATPMSDAIRSLEPQTYETSAQLEARFPALFARHWSQYGALVALPLSLHKQALGALALSYKSDRVFGEEDRRDLSAFARLCAWAVERARLFDVAQTERRRAEEANRVKDEFLAVVSHELRTPLHAMLGWATLARSGKLAGEALERGLLTIERNAHAQAKLVEDLLDVTRITSGKLRLNVEPTCPVTLVEAALDVVRPAAAAKGVQLLLSAGAMPETIVGDPDRLQQIVWNLLSNAVKFTERGGQVRVLLSADEAAVRITVEDTGLGIDPSFLPHIYERFRQAETSKRGRLGLGLGLAIVRHLVELHGGTIDARSEGLGHGSSFTVTLPCSSAPGHKKSLPSVKELAGDVMCPTQLKGLSALVIDDELESRELLSTLFESCHMRVRSAGSAAEGLRLLQEERPDVIVSDISMPEEDGYAFIEHVRRLPEQSGGSTPAVALTARAKWEDRTRALLSGFDMHLSKPVAAAELLVVVANVSGRLAAKN